MAEDGIIAVSTFAENACFSESGFVTGANGDMDEQQQNETRDEQGRFLPGNPGGPGRPKGKLSLMAIIERKLEEIPVGETRAFAEQLIEKYLTAIVKGEEPDGPAIRHLIEMFDGKPTQRNEIGGYEGNPIRIEFGEEFEGV